MAIAGHMAGKVLCEALGLDARQVQGLLINCRVAEPMRVLVQYLSSPLDLDRLADALRKLNPQDVQIVEGKSMSEIDRYWNQIPEHIREAIVKRVVADWISQTSAKPAAAPVAESASVPVPPAAIAGQDEDDAA